MARLDSFESPFYPPRANWLGKQVALLSRVRYRSTWRPPPPPQGARSWLQLVAWVMVPGLCFWSRDRWLLAFVLFGAWIMAGVAYLALMGIAGATLAYVLMTSVHSLTATIAIGSCFPADKADVRMWRASLGSFLIILCLYVFARPFGAFVLPFQFKDRTVLMNPTRSLDSIQRGEWVVYRLPNEAVAIDRVLALPGERISFHADHFSVGGTSYERIATNMPSDGEIHLAEGQYYIWPSSSRTNAHYGQATNFLVQFARVSRAEIIAPAYRRWFWRKQGLDPLVRLVPNASNVPRPSIPAKTHP